MTAWGPGLYSNDIGIDIRDEYKDQLKRGKESKEITDKLIEDYKMLLDDEDDAPCFWFALADTQWNVGRLEDRVKHQAIKHLIDGKDLERWKLEDPSEAKKREKVLIKLYGKLNTPQPEKKKIAQYKFFKCEWNVGDVYAYPLESEHAKIKGLSGRYLLLWKVAEISWPPGNIDPIVRIKITKDSILPITEEEINKLEFVKTKVIRNRKLNIDYFNVIHEDVSETPIYLKILDRTSKNIFPKSFIYLGNFPKLKKPNFEFLDFKYDDEIPFQNWKYFEELTINEYFKNNLGKY